MEKIGQVIKAILKEICFYTGSKVKCHEILPTYFNMNSTVHSYLQWWTETTGVPGISISSYSSVTDSR